MQEIVKGDKVEMYNCGEANFPKNKGKEFLCVSEPFNLPSGQEVIFLEGVSGSFSTKFLKLCKEK